MALSKEEAAVFLRDVLHLSDSISSKQSSSLTLLNEIVTSYMNVVPYQSVMASALPPSQRHLPTWEEIKLNQFAKRGGMCYENNMFMKELLNSIGFDVWYISTHVHNPNDHMTIMVGGLTNYSSRHWVDVGSTFPVFHAIPFDFETHSVEYDIGFVRQRFVKTSDGVEWHHQRLSPFDGCKLTDDGWYKFAHIKADTPCDLKTFESRMTDWYTVEDGNIFLQNPRAVTFKKNKLIAVKGKQLILETTDQTIERKEMENFDQLLQIYENYFPQLPSDIVQDALKSKFCEN